MDTQNLNTETVSVLIKTTTQKQNEKGLEYVMPKWIIHKIKKNRTKISIHVLTLILPHADELVRWF